MDTISIKNHPDPVIDALRKRLAADGWIIDTGFAHPIGLEGYESNIMASYEVPHGAGIGYDENKWYRMRAKHCHGAAYGGLLISELAVNQYGAFGKHDTPEQWADKAYEALTLLRKEMDRYHV